MINKGLITLFLICVFGSCNTKETKNSQTSDSYQATLTEESAGLKLIGRKGTAYEKGKIYGAALKEDISLHLAIWDSVVKEGVNLSQEQIYQIISEKTEFIEAINKYTPELLEEIHGIADGAEVDRKALLCYNMAEEIMNYFQNGYESCTNVGVINEHENLIAYNQDLPQFLHGNNIPTVLNDENKFIFAFPGSIGTSGMTKDFAVTCNSLSMLNMNKGGLPLSFMVRKLLTFSSLREAIIYIKNTPLAIPQNLLLVDRNQVINLEASANQVLEYSNPKSSRFLYHTNHPLVNTDYRQGGAEEIVCERFNHLDSVFTGFSAGEDFPFRLLDDVMSSQHPANIYSADTYFRFIGRFPHNKTKLPYLEVINPQKDKEPLVLTFN
jgi:isopenicillin-N N-acyltransferase-like protein